MIVLRIAIFALVYGGTGWFISLAVGKWLHRDQSDQRCQR